MKKQRKTLIGESAKNNIPMLFTKSLTLTGDGVVYHFSNVYEDEVANENYNADYIYGINPPFRGVFLVYLNAASGYSNQSVYLDNIYGEKRRLYHSKKTSQGEWLPYSSEDITEGYYLMTYDPEKQMLFVLE